MQAATTTVSSSSATKHRKPGLKMRSHTSSSKKKNTHYSSLSAGGSDHDHSHDDHHPVNDNEPPKRSSKSKSHKDKVAATTVDSNSKKESELTIEEIVFDTANAASHDEMEASLELTESASQLRTSWNQLQLEQASPRGPGDWNAHHNTDPLIATTNGATAPTALLVGSDSQIQTVPRSPRRSSNSAKAVQHPHSAPVESLDSPSLSQQGQGQRSKGKFLRGKINLQKFKKVVGTGLDLGGSSHHQYLPQQQDNEADIIDHQRRRYSNPQEDHSHSNNDNDDFHHHDNDDFHHDFSHTSDYHSEDYDDFEDADFATPQPAVGRGGKIARRMRESLMGVAAKAQTIGKQLASKGMDLSSSNNHTSSTSTTMESSSSTNQQPSYGPENRREEDQLRRSTDKLIQQGIAQSLNVSMHLLQEKEQAKDRRREKRKERLAKRLANTIATSSSALETNTDGGAVDGQQPSSSQQAIAPSANRTTSKSSVRRTRSKSPRPTSAASSSRRTRKAKLDPETKQRLRDRSERNEIRRRAEAEGRERRRQLMMSNHTKHNSSSNSRLNTTSRRDRHNHHEGVAAAAGHASATFSDHSAMEANTAPSIDHHHLSESSLKHDSARLQHSGDRMVMPSLSPMHVKGKLTATSLRLGESTARKQKREEDDKLRERVRNRSSMVLPPGSMPLIKDSTISLLEELLDRDDDDDDDASFSEDLAESFAADPTPKARDLEDSLKLDDLAVPKTRAKRTSSAGSGYMADASAMNTSSRRHGSSTSSGLIMLEDSSHDHNHSRKAFLSSQRMEGERQAKGYLQLRIEDGVPVKASGSPVSNAEAVQSEQTEKKMVRRRSKTKLTTEGSVDASMSESRRHHHHKTKTQHRSRDQQSSRRKATSDMGKSKGRRHKQPNSSRHRSPHRRISDEGHLQRTGQHALPRDSAGHASLPALSMFDQSASEPDNAMPERNLTKLSASDGNLPTLKSDNLDEVSSPHVLEPIREERRRKEKRSDRISKHSDKGKKNSSGARGRSELQHGTKTENRGHSETRRQNLRESGTSRRRPSSLEPKETAPHSRELNANEEAKDKAGLSKEMGTSLANIRW